jgi:hypothetical protein
MGTTFQTQRDTSNFFKKRVKYYENRVSFDLFLRGFLGAGAFSETTSPGTSSSEDISTQIPARRAYLMKEKKIWDKKNRGTV